MGRFYSPLLHVQKGCLPCTVLALNPAVRVTQARSQGLSQGPNHLGDEGPDFWIVRDRQRTLESLRLVREVVPSGHRDELARTVRRLGPLPRDFEEVVSPEVLFLGLDRLELHVVVPPASVLGFHCRQTSEPGDGPAGDRGRPYRCI